MFGQSRKIATVSGDSAIILLFALSPGQKKSSSYRIEYSQTLSPFRPARAFTLAAAMLHWQAEIALYEEGIFVPELRPDQINILDLSVIAQGRHGLRNLVIAGLANFIFRKRTIARRREALGLPSDTKKIWLVIDEAHNFCPSGKSTLSNEILVRWAKEGRQPGLSLIVASQQPAAIDREILIQCGIRIVHRITSRDDFQAVNALSQDYLGDGLGAQITRLAGPGETLVIDDRRETVIHTQVRPRQSLHGGGSA